VSENSHLPVLLEEVIEQLAINPEGIYLDGTFGRGGHSRAILSKLNAKGRLIVIDQDPEAIAVAKQQFGDDKRVTIVADTFANLGNIVQELNLTGQINGLLLDFGVSSPQLDTPERGFSFMHDGPLDMRMNPQQGISVAEWLNHEASQEELTTLLFRYGEEKFSRKIAKRILDYCAETPISRTSELAEIVSKAIPKREKGKHPATRTFQALRIFINNELGAIEEVLNNIPPVLAPGGRVAIISFHSLEDRLVKNYFRDLERGPILPKEIPIMVNEYVPVLKRVGKAIRPTEQECARNPRARSAVLRVAQKK
jgi:16S rRNA (cytosine1402-N4)-methyltransferase